MLRLSLSLQYIAFSLSLSLGVFVYLLIEWASITAFFFLFSSMYCSVFAFVGFFLFISVRMRMHNNHLIDLKMSFKFENECDARCLLTGRKLWAFTISELVSKRRFSHRKENTPTKIEIDVLYNILLYIVFLRQRFAYASCIKCDMHEIIARCNRLKRIAQGWER